MPSEVLSNTSRWLLSLTAVLVALGLLNLPARWSNRVGHLWFIVLVLQFALRRYAQRHATAAEGRLSQKSATTRWMSLPPTREVALAA